MLSSWGAHSKYGEYEIVCSADGAARLLGVGSFGKTFEAVRVSSIGSNVLKKYVALKVLDPGLLGDEEKRFQFIREIETLTEFRHPNLIHYISCGEDHGEVYYAMELCRGGDLSKLVARFGPLPERAAALLAEQVAKGLKQLHNRHGVVHRDLKPSNIMLVEEIPAELNAQDLASYLEEHEALLRVVDFGLVNYALDQDEVPQRFVGSAVYASPEQIREQPVDGRSDLYSLGMTLWHLVLGKGPLLDSTGAPIEDMDEALRRHTAPEEYASSFPDHLSVGFCSLLGRLVAKSSEDRFRNATEVQQALREYLHRPNTSGETPFAITQLTGTLDSAYEFGARRSWRSGSSTYDAKDKSSGAPVRLTVLSVAKGTASAEDLARRLYDLALRSRDPSCPEEIMRVLAIVRAEDVIACTEEFAEHVTLGELLKTRAKTKRPLSFTEAIPVLQPIAEALDFLIERRQETVALRSEEIRLTGPGGVAAAADPELLTRGLDEWEAFGVRFSAICLPPAPGSGIGNFLLGTGNTGSMQLTGVDLHPVRAFARLVYRIVSGSEVAAAVKVAPNAYVPAVTLTAASNELIRDLVGQRRQMATVGSVLKEFLANEGYLRSPSTRGTAPGEPGPKAAEPPLSTRANSAMASTFGPAIPAATSASAPLPPPPLPPTEPEPGPTPPSRPATVIIQLSPVPQASPPAAAPAPAPALEQRVPAAIQPVEDSRSVDTPERQILPKPPEFAQPVGGPKGIRRFDPRRGVAAALLLVVGTALATLVWTHQTKGRSHRHRATPPAVKEMPPPKPAAPTPDAASAHAAAAPAAPVEEPSVSGGEGSALAFWKGAFAGRYSGEMREVSGIRFRWCPDGSFLMGSAPSEALNHDEEWQHLVKLTNGFWLAETELTQGQWMAVMGTTLLQQTAKAIADDTLYEIDGRGVTIRDYLRVPKGGSVNSVVGAIDPSFPMYWINWSEASDFCSRLGRRREEERDLSVLPPGWKVELPTEAQWEYACRAGTRTAFYGVESAESGRPPVLALDAIAWYRGNSAEGYVGQSIKAAGGDLAGPRSVGLKKANPWSLSDMLGNVNEWCRDWFGDYRAGESDGLSLDPIGPSSGARRVMRGGAWNTTAARCRAAARGSAPAEYRFHNIGFRPAIVFAPPE